jgi:carbamoyltransferase
MPLKTIKSNKLLSVYFLGHDCNISYFDGNNIFYHKFERSKHIKRYAWKDNYSWIDDLKCLWNVNIDEVSEIVLSIGATNETEFKHQPYVAGSEFPATNIKNILSNTELWWIKHPNISIINHHYCHALSTWMLVEKPDVSIVIDGIGDFKSWSVFKNDKIIDSGHIKECGSIGWAMRDYGLKIGITAGNNNDIAGKLMGLQSYGTLDEEYLKILQSKKFTVKDINDIFSLDNWILYKKNKLLAELTKLNHIKTVHYYMETVLIEFFKKYCKTTDIISYTGGVAQNVIWNTSLRKVFPNLVIPPHSSDEGLSLGGLEYLRRKHNLPIFNLKGFPYLANDQAPTSSPKLDTIKYAAKLLAEGNIIGWYQGQGEIGPRALGNRSILMNPRVVDGRVKINTIKNREQFRPFGASVLKEHASKYFDIDKDDPHMLYIVKVLTEDLKSITHVDGTCRIQTVDKDVTIFHKLIEEFYKITGLPILLNTSLNVAGKPIAGHINNARELFYDSKLDYMFIGNEILSKQTLN